MVLSFQRRILGYFTSFGELISCILFPSCGHMFHSCKADFRHLFYFSFTSCIYYFYTTTIPYPSSSPFPFLLHFRLYFSLFLRNLKSSFQVYLVLWLAVTVESNPYELNCFRSACVNAELVASAQLSCQHETATNCLTTQVHMITGYKDL